MKQIHKSKILSKPRSIADIYLSFSWIALQGFGGVVALLQHELVEKKQWMSREQFIDDWVVAQLLPGPNVVNLSMIIGHRHFGIFGAFAALSGMLVAPFMIVLAIAAVFGAFTNNPILIGILRGLGAVSAGLITATGLKLIAALRTNILGLKMCYLISILTFAAIGLFRWKLIWVLLGGGAVACLMAFIAISDQDC
ncbi:chromate transporter [Acidovorax temperans]|uniref:chromate transporter n=1 Tax=Acidovorax temperans TaxID=80878 RepID=UPI0035B4D5F6